jgi:hypothetical protein
LAGEKRAPIVEVDRKSDMAPRQVRSKVAVVTTSLGLAVLLAGPASTFGLGVPVVGGADNTTSQVTSTVQRVVETTQQTAATTVTNVESAVQTTVQATTPAVVPQQAAPARPQTRSQTVSRHTPTAVKKQVAAVTRPRAAVKRVASPSERTSQAVTAAAEPVRTVARKRTRLAHATTTDPQASTASPAGRSSAACDVPALALLPGGSQFQALLAIVCDAAGGLVLPGRIDLTPTAAGAPVTGDVLGAIGARRLDPRRARSASLAPHVTTGFPSRPSAAAAQAGHPGTPIVASGAGGAGRAGALTYLAAIHPARTSARPDKAARASHHHHHGFLSGQTPGTAVLVAIIFANLAILAGIALWRLAVRWVIPRFA